jgi:hypothetical protein
LVLKKENEDQLDGSYEKCSIALSGGQEYPTFNQLKEADWFGHILRSNCLLKRVIEGKIEERIEVTGRRGRRRERSY